jgi:hypothetical protein
MLAQDAVEPDVVFLDSGLPEWRLASELSVVVLSTSRRSGKSAWIDIGSSAHSVPSLLNVATRASGRTTSALPGRVTVSATA